MTSIALVTGAAGAIGSAVARVLAEEGYEVVLTDIDGAGLESVASSFGRPDVVVADVSKEDEVASLAAGMASRSGTLDLVVHCAGVLGPRDLLTATAEEWDGVFVSNARSSFLVIRETAELMKSTGGGCIIAVSSIAAKEARRDYIPYNASKAAVLNLMWSSALLLAPHGIRCHAVCPGPVDTPMWEQLAGESTLGPDTARARRQSQIPMGRFAAPDDVAAVVAFLASDAAAYLTGLTIDVAGGARLGMGT
jgi:NAD(P)-dependent dehydrogenase (short-subunit alcohol dehydrogenase family)